MEPKPKRRRLEPVPLDSLGVAELRDYIAELRAEIARADAAIALKTSHRGEAERFFRS